LPDPVGATTRAFDPAEMAFQAPSCAAVGAEKAPANHSEVAGVNLLNTDVTPTSSPTSPTFEVR
jgi:hypothetical protein